MRTTEEPTAAYVDAALERIEAGLTRGIRNRRRRTAGFAVAAAAIVVAVVAGSPFTTGHRVVTSPPQALGHTRLTAADVASWTSTPRSLPDVTSVVAQCEATLASEPQASGTPTVISSDARGQVQSAIVALGGYSGYCIGTTAGQSVFVVMDVPDAENTTNYTPPPVASDAINLGSSGANTGPNGWNFAEGAVGSDVTGVTLHENGVDVNATVANGTWMAWWPIFFHNGDGVIGGTITITSADGTKSTVTPAQIQLN